MEVASSPHIANLYAAKCEQYMQSLSNVLLYKHYIDDIFTIIIESSEEDALAYAKSKRAFPGLRLKWEVDTYRMVFLDLEVTHVLSTGKFDFRPY